MSRRAQANAADRLKELEFFEGLARRCPGDPEILAALGDLLTAAGRIEEGLRVDLTLARACPDKPLVWYNLACSYARLGRADKALAALDRAVALGYRDAHWMRSDRDLDSLRDDPRFDALLRRLSGPRA